MFYAYPTDKQGLSDVLAQLLGPSPQPPTGTIQNSELTEESDLALSLRLLLGPDPKQC
jgi:hypothetical protein